MENNKKTIVVNLLAGPGAGKTTCAWEIASELKKRNLETEYVSEYAKEFVWENKTDILDGSLEHQKILYEEQKRRVDRLIGKVDVIVTDSPTILSLLYLKQPNEEFEEKAVKEFKANSNFNLFINRGKNFQQTGRIHSLEESKKIDNKIRDLLEKYDIYFGTYYHSTMDVVVDNIIKNYNNINKIENKENTKNTFKQTQYTIYQLKVEENLDRNLCFSPFDFLKNGAEDIQTSNYEKVYTGNMKSIDISSKEEILDTCEKIYTIFNLTEEMPNDFEGHSLSVSDIIVIECNGESKAYYCDSIGFKEIPTFIEQIKSEKINKNEDKTEDFDIDL